MTQRRSVMFTIAVAATVLLGACSNSASPSPAAPTATPPAATAGASSASPATAASPSGGVTAGAGGTLTFGLYQTFTSFFPWSETGSGGDSLSMQLHWDQLASYDEKNLPQMRLADSITSSADAKTWTVKLKSGLMWSDGSPLTSKDVIFSWKLGANPKMSYNSGLWTNVVGMTDWQKGPDYSKDFTGITAPDDQTIVFQLIQPNAAFESVLLNFRNFILPQAAVLAAAPKVFTLDNKGIWALPFWQSPTIGEGPYIWDKTQTGQFMSYKPNPHWRGGALEFSSVVFKPESSQAVAAAQLQAGDIDIATVTLNDLPGLTAAGFTTGTALAPFPVETDFNDSAASRFSDVKVRQAFMYGCDRQGFVDSYLQGKGQAPDTYFFPDWVDKTGINLYAFDINKAKSLLDDAKFDYSKPVVWMSWNAAAADRQAFVQDCQSKMKSIGVTVQLINGLDVTNKLGQEGQWDLQTYGGYPIVDPDQITQFTACSAIGSTAGKDSATFPNGHAYKYGGANAVNYCNPAFDTLMSQGATVTDQAQRATLYKQAQAIWINDVPMMVGYRAPTVYAWNAKVSGIALYGDPGTVDLKIDQWVKAP
jgi:peptide/nickel transport system substrate-binding protein